MVHVRMHARLEVCQGVGEIHATSPRNDMREIHRFSASFTATARDTPESRARKIPNKITQIWKLKRVSEGREERRGRREI